MKSVLILVLVTFSFADESSWWGCMDENAYNFDPYAIWDCEHWCCEYEDLNHTNIIINEINYNPSSDYNQSDEDYEFIEFFNNGDETVNMDGWYLNNSNVDQCFAFDNISINAGEYLVLARNASTYPGSIHYGEHNSLSNSEGTLTLRDSHYNVVDRVSYKDDCDCENELYCWPTNADAGGSSLELVDPNSNNNFASSWQDSYVIPGGTPGLPNSTSEELVYGCTDVEACNYNPDANANNDSCDYPEENFDCNGNCIVEVDCSGECGGAATEDCLGDCNGLAELDDCDVCNGNNQDIDCNGDCFGDAQLDACGTCNGEIGDVNACADEGFSIGIVNTDVENQFFDISLNNESEIAGFQFSIAGVNILEVTPLSIENLNFSISFSSNTILGFSLDGNLIAPSNTSILRVFFNNQSTENVCLEEIILSNPNGEEVNVSNNGCIEISACNDITACNYTDYSFSCQDCCSYGEEFWLDTDGDGLGYLENGQIFCEDPGSPWVPNHGDDYPNCFSNQVDSCDVCDGDNSSCSGCTDELAFNYNCLNGNWPSTATYGCLEDVLVDDGSCLYPPSGFEFVQSTEQAFYKFIDGSFNGEPLEFMGNWIGAFRGDVCVGAWPWVGGQFTQVPVMGSDGQDYSSDYMLEGEFPEFYIYDPGFDEIFPADISENFPYINLEIYHIDNIESGNGDWSEYGFFLGDVNIDYSIDITDMTSQINFILSHNHPSSYEFWASDVNSDSQLNVADVVNLSNNILGLSRASNDAKGYFEYDRLLLEGGIGGVQFTGNIRSEIKGADILESNNGTNIVYNLNGELDTKIFEFDILPQDLLVVSSSGSNVELSNHKVNSFELNSVYPNPFNPRTNINFKLNDYENINLSIYDIKGRLVEVLLKDYAEPGTYEITWDANNFPSGMYFLKISSDNFTHTQKLNLIK